MIVGVSFDAQMISGNHNSIANTTTVSNFQEIINTCDAGREEELIFRTVYNLSSCKKPPKRLWISSMEDAAILSGFNDLKDGADYDRLYGRKEEAIDDEPIQVAKANPELFKQFIKFMAIKNRANKVK